MGSHSYLQNLGDTYIQNYQAMGETNFQNQYGHGNTQVDNLIGTQGSIQNFGLQQLYVLGGSGSIGPLWTYNPSVPAPLGQKQIGSSFVVQYTPEQLASA